MPRWEQVWARRLWGCDPAALWPGVGHLASGPLSPDCTVAVWPLSDGGSGEARKQYVRKAL